MTVDREALIETTRSLVNVPSENPPGDESEVADVLVERLDASPVPFDVDRYDALDGRPNVVATAGGSETDNAGSTTEGDAAHVLLTGHMDVVPAIPDDWTGDPYEMRREDGRLIGRGTADMKAALAAKLIAAESYLLENPNGCRVTLAFVADEEWDGTGTRVLAERGVEADVAVIGEPTDLQVCIAQKGVARYRASVRGRSAHSGMPRGGRDAIRGLTQLLVHAESLDAELRETTTHPQLEPETLTVTEVNGGIAPNVVAETASATIDWRTHPGRNGMEQRIADLVEASTERYPDLEIEAEQLVFARGAEVDPDHELVRLLVSAAADVGVESQPVGFNAATDARFLIHEAGVPTVLFGPGSIEEDAHTVDESISEEDLYRTACTYEAFLHRFENRST